MTYHLTSTTTNDSPVSMSNAQNGARIKVFGGNPSPNSTAGGGTGYVRNITFVDFRNTNVDYPIYINQCYSTAAATCLAYPSKLSISDVHCTFPAPSHS
jgi:galacturan 1,4-alpha-galacturonidase